MVYILLGTGFEETEAVAPLDLLRRAGIEALTVGIGGKIVTGSNGISIVSDITLGEMDLSRMDMIVVPGGRRGIDSVRNSPEAMEAIRFAWENDKFVAAICAGPTVLADLHIPDGREATCYPGFEAGMGSAKMIPGVPFVRDGRLITGTSAGSAIPFGLALVAALKSEQAANIVAKQIVIR